MPSLSQEEATMKQPLLSDSAPQHDSPPAYEYGANTDGNRPKSPKPVSPPSAITVERMVARPSTYVYQSTSRPTVAPTVYNYVNPLTGETVVSLLPPTHPEMICLQAGAHIPESHFGILGILAAIFWFPIGIACCLLDRQVRCRRCGVVIDNGICD